MSPTIRVDDDVYEALKQQAEPFVDTPNSVLRRVLGLAELSSDAAEWTQSTEKSRSSEPRTGTRRRRRPKTARQPRAKTGSILPEADYEIPLLQIIAEHGGRAASREVLDELETRLGDRLTEVDKQTLASGDVRWRNRAQFVRLSLVERGDMVKDSPRGIWEITSDGRKRVSPRAVA